MEKWMKVTLAVTVPALSFLVLNDTIQGYYGPSRDVPLAYSVIEEEEPEADAAVAEDALAEAAETATAIFEEDAVEEVSADAGAEDIAVAEDAPEEEVAADQVAAEETTVAVETPAENATPAEEATAEEITPAANTSPEEEQSTEVAMLSPEEMNAGEAAARACASCHQFERERNAAGPHLVGLNGRAAGSVEGFRYSRALQDLNAEGHVWDMETLQVWLENPDAFADGTRMMYKVDDAEDRRLIAGWLTQRDN